MGSSTTDDPASSHTKKSIILKTRLNFQQMMMRIQIMNNTSRTVDTIQIKDNRFIKDVLVKDVSVRDVLDKDHLIKVTHDSIIVTESRSASFAVSLDVGQPNTHKRKEGKLVIDTKHESSLLKSIPDCRTNQSVELRQYACCDSYT
jgi:DNA-binding protein